MAYKAVALGVGAVALVVGALVTCGFSRLTNLVSSSSSSSGWRSPDFDKLKMNTAGSVTNSEVYFDGQAGFGVVIRGDLGGWRIGFYGRVRDCSSSTEAELWGIYKGLKIIEENNFREVEIETDCKLTIELIIYGNHGKSRIRKIAEECKVMMQRRGCTLKLIDNNANKVAVEWPTLEGIKMRISSISIFHQIRKLGV